jgi:hypothetical protein
MTTEAATGTSDPDAKEELELMESIYSGLKRQPPEVRQRVLAWVLDRLDGAPLSLGRRHSGTQHGAPHEANERITQGSVTYGTFADLYNAAHSTTAKDMALVGAYWFQVCQGADEFVAAEVNKELKNAGAKVANITVAFNGLIESSPRLVLQVKKSGKSMQARKRYKLTLAGIKAVEDMIRGAGGE